MDMLDGGPCPSADEFIGHVRQWLAAGLSRDEAAAKLAELAPNRSTIENMDVTWLRTMARLRSDDFPATAVLRVTEAALRLVPRPGPGQS